MENNASSIRDCGAPERRGDSADEDWENAPPSPVLCTAASLSLSQRCAVTETAIERETFEEAPVGGNPVSVAPDVPPTPLDLIERLYATAGAVRAKDLLFLFDRERLCELLSLLDGRCAVDDKAQWTERDVAARLVVALDRHRGRAMQERERERSAP